MKYIGKMKRLDEGTKNTILNSWNDNSMSMADIGRVLHVTRQCVFKFLKSAGADTTKRKLPFICYTCGKESTRTRKKLRTNKLNFCCEMCYLIYLETLGEHYRPSAYHCRVGRKAISQHHEWQPGQVIHHVNKDDTDNRLENLEVYANQSDHLKKHRGKTPVEPIWKGIDYI